MPHLYVPMASCQPTLKPGEEDNPIVTAPDVPDDASGKTKKLTVKRIRRQLKEPAGKEQGSLEFQTSAVERVRYGSCRHCFRGTPH